MEVNLSFIFYLVDSFGVIQDVSNISFLCKHFFFFSHLTPKPLYAQAVFRLNDVVTFVVTVLQLRKST